MPAPTRQATPGPSTILQPHTTQSVNFRKRAATEPGIEERDTKKPRADAPTIGDVNGAKDKKRKKRKKKRRTSVVLQDPPMEHRRVRSGSRSLAPLSAASTIVSQRATPNAEPVASAVPGTPNREILAEEEEEEPVLSSSDKGKGKAKSDSPSPSHPPQPIAPPIAGPSSPTMPDSSAQASEVARLKAQLAEQTTLLKRHQTHLNHHQQSLTCQICLDLMHKPYALAPCGHITCYGCLVRWFTAPQNPQQQNGNAAGAAEPQQDSIEHILNSPAVRNGAFMRRRKTCPICRAVVQERPIEMWGIKSMVAALVRSELTDLPAPAAEVDPPPAAAGGAANNGRDNNDPWRNVFRRAGARNNFGAYMYDHLLPVPPQMNPNPYGPPQAPGGAGPNGGEADRDQMGWYDMEDGGIYRCVDCYHEIWEGVCTSCNRRYPGHNYLDDDDDDIRFDDSDDDDEDDGGYDAHFRGGIGRFMEAIMNDSGLDDEDEEELELGLLEAQDLEEEIEAREVALRQLAEEQLGHWNHDREAVAMLNELVDEDDEHEAEDPDDYEEQLWHVRRYLGGDARIEEVDDDDEEGEEDSQYGGSFIDDQAVEEQANELAVNDERGSEDEVEFVEPPRQHNARRPAHRPLVVVESTDDEDESEAENSRALARQLGRGTTLGRPQPFMERRTRYVELSDDDEDHGGSDIHFSDSDGEPEAVENDSGLDYISEEEPDEAPITHTRIGRRRVVYEDSDS